MVTEPKVAEPEGQKSSHVDGESGTVACPVKGLVVLVTEPGGWEGEKRAGRGWSARAREQKCALATNLEPCPRL